MIPVPRKHLPENRPKVLSPEELAERREAARQRLAMKKGLSIESFKFLPHAPLGWGIFARCALTFTVPFFYVCYYLEISS